MRRRTRRTGRPKSTSIEHIDKHIVGPVLEKLQTFPEWRILVMPDHPTNIATRKHGYAPTLFGMAGTRVQVPSPRPVHGEARGRERSEDRARA